MALEAGTRLGPYEILAPLGAGGMGEVYRARDTRLGRHVAIKVLPPAASGDATSRERFEREARMASALSHPNICPLFDVGEQDGQSYLVMECLQGQTLAIWLQDGPLAIDRALAIAAQAADGLAHAHAAGVIHRDLKPGNVMVLPDGNVKILDFGLARKVANETDVTTMNLTAPGGVSGTVAYMSPEQTLGKRLDHRSDIFSLGVVLYEMLCGRRPFTGASTFAVMHSVVGGEVPPADVVRPGVPPAVARFLERMMAKSPDERPAAAGEVAAFLRQQAPLPMSGATALASGAATTIAGARLPAQGAADAAPSAVAAATTWSYARVAGGGLAAAAVVAGIVLGVLWLRGSSTPRSSSMPAAVAVPASTPTTALEHTQLGLGLLRRFDRTGAVEKAIASFEAAIALDKTFAPAWAGMARAYWRQQKDTRDPSVGARAVDAAGQAIALDPYLADAHVSLGLARMVSGDVPAAKAAFDHALVLDPANPGAHRGLGDLAEQEDRLSEATSHYQKALEFDPTDWELPRLLGDIPYRTAQYGEALTWYRQAAAAAPDSAVPFRLMGGASHMLGDYPAAASAYQKSLAIQPSSAGYTNLGTTIFYQGLYRESLQAFERAVDMAPGSPLVWGNVADAYRFVPGNAQKSRDSYARAVQLLREQLAKDPTNAANRSRLALYLAKSGDAATGLAELAKVLTPGVRDVNTLYRGAITYELAGDRDRALRTLEVALDRGYAVAEVRMDPELARLRNDARYHRLIARFDGAAALK